MPKQAYAVYVSTFQSAVDALKSGDDERLHAMCREVAARSGIASTVSLMAVSDAECGRPLRTHAGIRGLFWRNPPPQCGPSVAPQPPRESDAAPRTAA